MEPQRIDGFLKVRFIFAFLGCQYQTSGNGAGVFPPRNPSNKKAEKKQSNPGCFFLKNECYIEHLLEGVPQQKLLRKI